MVFIIVNANFISSWCYGDENVGSNGTVFLKFDWEIAIWGKNSSVHFVTKL